MIFGNLNEQPSGPPAPSGETRRRRRRSSRRPGEDSGPHRRRRSSFETASRLTEPSRSPQDRGHAAWLWVLGALIVAVAGFAIYLHAERGGATFLPGEAPTAKLLPFVDPILAPLQTGDAGYSPETLGETASTFRAERDKVNRDDADVYATAATIAGFLQQALEDRARHLERLERIDAPAAGQAETAAPRPAISETQRKHLELAVDVSWQRNSTAHRNSIEELWARLTRLEQGRFRAGSAAPAQPAPPRRSTSRQ